MKQHTLQRPVSIAGVGLHTGARVTVGFEPAPAGSGLRFRRTDLAGSPDLAASAALVSDTRRGTSLTSGDVTVHTVEHAVSALVGCGIDNALITLDGPEVPILDGSAAPFVALIGEAGRVEQDAPRAYRTLAAPVAVSKGASSVVLLPHDGLRITCTSTDDRGFHTQELTIDLDPETYATAIAPARTFTFFEDIKPLLDAGKIKGGSLDCAIVVKDGKAEAVGGLRFADEFVRHKILDLVGDLALAAGPLKAHIIAVRPGHGINNEAARALAAAPAPAAPAPVKTAPATVPGKVALWEAETLDVRRILDLLPHRYPFMMIDRVVEFRGEDELVARKCVTFNEPFFLGHFPGNPVMPGVMQVEAMAQASGILLLRKLRLESSLAFFMSVDKAKFRKAVVPGDVLSIEVKLTKVRGKIGVAEGVCKVDGQVTSSAELMFTLVDSKPAA